MINFNGEFLDKDNGLTQNRAFLYGDAVFETLKIRNNSVLFLEDHYFRLMASMRILRMEIPMYFTMEFMEEQILSIVAQNGYSDSARARITVFRNDGGLYLPLSNSISYLIHSSKLEVADYQLNSGFYEVDLFKDFHIAKHLLSTLKTTNKLIQVTASIYAKENGLDNCILMNETKNVVEVLQGNLFMLQGKSLITAPISEGCIKGVMRKQILDIAKKYTDIEVAEAVISPFDLQKAEELFFTNVITGIQPITKYRKKEYETNLSQRLTVDLNQFIS